MTPLALRKLLLLVAVFTACVCAVEPDVTSSSTTPDKVLQVSLDGTCGNGITCLGSNWGQCCSEHGYCGNSEAYCGEGCHTAFGTCAVLADDESPPRAACPAPVENVTKTTTVTSTEWVAVTETRPPAGWCQATRDVTRIVPVTSVVLFTSTRHINRVETLTAALTINVTKLSTSLNVVHETSTSTRLFRTTSTSLVVETSTNYINKTNIVATTFTLTVTANLSQEACRSTPSPTPSSTAQVTATIVSTSTRTATVIRGPGGPWRRPPTAAPALTTTQTVTVPAATTVTYKPSSATAAESPAASPTLRGMTAECKKFYKTVDDDNCSKVLRREGITRDQLLTWNPSLGLRNARDLCEWEDIKNLEQGKCRMDCSDLWPEYVLCVGI